MRQVKLVLVIMGLIGFFVTGYSISSEPYKSDDEKENGSTNNALKEYGPLTVCADNVIYNSNKGVLVYSGNVFVMQIHNKHILCKKIKNPKKNASYFTRNKSYTFKELQKKWLVQAKDICAKEKGCNFISGQKLIIILDKDNNVQTLTMDAEKDEFVRFYTYPTNTDKDFKNSKQLTKGPLNGEGKMVVYSVVNKSLVLNSKAMVTQNENTYKGDKIIYDMVHDLVSIPGSKNKRSKIVLDGIQDETKMDMGLTPIADFNKKPTVSTDEDNPAVQ